MSKLSQIQNINGRLIPTAEVTSLIEQTTKARITEIYIFFLKKKKIFARYFGLQYKPSSGAERKRTPRKVCIANRNIGHKFVFFKNKYISVILAFVVCSVKLVTSAVGISLPLIFNIPKPIHHDQYFVAIYKTSCLVWHYLHSALHVTKEGTNTISPFSARGGRLSFISNYYRLVANSWNTDWGDKGNNLFID